MSCVLDASAALSALLASQRTVAADAFFAAPPAPLQAPAVFRLEVRQALVRLERRGLSPTGAADAAVSLLEEDITFEPSPDDAALARALGLARAHKLSVYDALYLDLALVSGAALASRDGPLLDAGALLGLNRFDLR